VASYRVTTKTNNSNNKTTQDKTTTTKVTIKKQRKIDRLRIFTLKHELLKISVNLQTAFAAETQWLEE
jgi:hypothetical protein